MLKGNESPVVREIRGPRHRIRLDLSQQVLRLSVPDDPFVALETSAGEQTIHPTLRDLPFQQVGFVPAGLLIQKAKQFDDGHRPAYPVCRIVVRPLRREHHG